MRKALIIGAALLGGTTLAHADPNPTRTAYSDLLSAQH